MTCEDFIAGLCLQTQPLAALRAHAGSCAQCRALYRADLRLRAAAARAPALGLSPQLRSVLEAHTAAALPWPRHVRGLVVLGLVAVCITLERIASPRIDLAAGTPPAFWFSLGALGAWWLAIATLRQQRGRVGLGLPVWLRWTGAALGLLGFELLAVAHASGVLRVTADAANRAPPPRDCLLQGLVIAALVSVASVLMDRRSVIEGPASAGALLGCVAGLASALVLHAHCHAIEVAHLQLVHGLPVLLAIGAGAWAGRRWLAAT